MALSMNRHFVEMLRALSEAGVEYLVIGAHAAGAHGHVRATKDLDVWIRPSRENAERVRDALAVFGAPLEELTIEDLIAPGTVYQIGIDPVRIDILTSPAGLDFDQAWKNRLLVEIEGDRFFFLGKKDLIRGKRATGRPQDLLDADALEQIPE